MQWRYLQEQAKRKKILDDRNKEFGNFKDEEDTESVDSIDLDVRIFFNKNFCGW